MTTLNQALTDEDGRIVANILSSLLQSSLKGRFTDAIYCEFNFLIQRNRRSSAVLQILKNSHSPIETIQIRANFEAKQPDQETLSAESGRVLNEIGFAPMHFASKFMLDDWLASIFDDRLNKKPLTHDMEGFVRRALLTKFFESFAIELNKHDLPIECYVKKLITAQDTLLDATVAEETIQIVKTLIGEHLISQE